MNDSLAWNDGNLAPVSLTDALGSHVGVAAQCHVDHTTFVRGHRFQHHRAVGARCLLRHSVSQTMQRLFSTRLKTLYVYHQVNCNTAPVRIARFDYRLNEEVVPLPVKFQRTSAAPWLASN